MPAFPSGYVPRKTRARKPFPSSTSAAGPYPAPSGSHPATVLRPMPGVSPISLGPMPHGSAIPNLAWAGILGAGMPLNFGSHGWRFWPPHFCPVRKLGVRLAPRKGVLRKWCSEQKKGLDALFPNTFPNTPFHCSVILLAERFPNTLFLHNYPAVREYLAPRRDA